MPTENLKEELQINDTKQQDNKNETVEDFLKSQISDNDKANKFGKAISDIKIDSK